MPSEKRRKRAPGSPGSRLLRRIGDLRHLRVVVDRARSDEARENPDVDGGRRRRRLRAALGLLAVLLAAFTAATRVTVRGHFYGLYLLKTESGRPLELKDNLRFGDGPRVLAGVSLGAIRELFASQPPAGPRLEVDWDQADGGGVIKNILADGRELRTFFGRYVDDEKKPVHGLFVGGAISEVAADVTGGRAQNQSGMAVRDAHGWSHIWCTVNEALMIVGLRRVITPAEWKLVETRVLVDSARRVVVRSEHDLEIGEVHLRMERYAYFRAGQPFFRLGVNIMNVGEEAVRIHYAYGDEPWVGEYGSAAGNVGWTAAGLVTTVSSFERADAPWAGITDVSSGQANFVSWEGSPPDKGYFGNRAGTPLPDEYGAPLSSNEVAIGLEWRNRSVEPDGVFRVALTIGLADRRSDGSPALPAGVLSPR